MATTDTEPSSTKKRSVALGSRLATWGAAVALPIMGLANLSEAVLLLEEGRDKVISTFTHIPEYEDLSYLKVGTTSEFVKHIFAMPQVRRSLNNGISADYYFDEKYLLTVLIKNEEVRGYTILSLNESFHPSVFEDKSQEFALGEFTFEGAPGLPRDFRVDWTKTLGLYIEEMDLGLKSLGKNAFLGRLTYGASTSDPAVIGGLYNAMILDETIKLERARRQVRENLMPNLYGWGDVSLETIEASFLTTSQFGNYAAAYQ